MTPRCLLVYSAMSRRREALCVDVWSSACSLVDCRLRERVPGHFNAFTQTIRPRARSGRFGVWGCVERRLSSSLFWCLRIRVASQYNATVWHISYTMLLNLKQQCKYTYSSHTHIQLVQRWYQKSITKLRWVVVLKGSKNKLDLTF